MAFLAWALLIISRRPILDGLKKVGFKLNDGYHGKQT